MELYSGATEYDYDIDAYTGDILFFDYDAEYYTPGQSLGNTAMNGTSITADQDKQIALQHAGVDEANTRRMEMDIGYDHGRTTYEFSWKVNWTEYEYEIDAATGDIISAGQK